MQEPASLKFDRGSYFLKSIFKKIGTLGQIHCKIQCKSTFRILFGDVGALLLQM